MYPKVTYNENKTTVSKVEAMELLDYFYNCEIVQAAYTQIDMHLFLNGLSLEQGIDQNPEKKKDKEDMNPIFMESFRKDWTPLARQANVHFAALGYCVLFRSKDVYEAEGKKFETPVANLIPRDKYELERVVHRDFRVEYIARVEGFDFEDVPPEVMVFVMPGREPDSHGRHRCLLRPLLPCYKNIRLFQMYNDMALQQRAHPPVFIEKENAIADSSNATFIKNQFDTVQYNMMDGKKTNKNRLRQHEITPSEIAHLPSKKPRIVNQWDNINSYYNNRIELFSQSHEDNMVPIPMGFKLCSGGAPAAEPPTDILPMMDAYRDRVFAMFGIPTTTVFAQLSTKNGSSSAIDLDNADGAKLNKALRGFQETITEMMTSIFNEVFPTHAKKFQIKLMIFSPLSITQALTLDNMDMIERNMTQRLVMQRVGLDDKNVFKGRNEHYRPIPGQNELMTTELMKARTEEIYAKKEELLAKAKVSKAEATGIKEEGYHPPKAPSASS